jgi:hypothetical protein
LDIPVGVTGTQSSSKRTDRLPSVAAMKPQVCSSDPQRMISRRN